MPDNKNTIVDIKKFFEDEAHPVSSNEFNEFWTSLTDEEKVEYKNTDLPK